MALRNINKLLPVLPAHHNIARNANLLVTKKPLFLTRQSYSTEENLIQPTRNKRINKGILANIERIEARAQFMKEQEHEYEIGRRHLANMMGENPEFFTQEDIDRALAYLLPSGIYHKYARPTMKPPEQVFAKEKEAQFDEYGRPFHPLFFTITPTYHEKLHVLACKVRRLDHMKTTMAMTTPVNTMSDLMLSTRWVTCDELMTLHEEKYRESQYDFFITSLEHLVKHPLGFREKEFIEYYRKPLDTSKKEEIKEIQHTDDGIPFTTHTTRCIQSHATVTVYPRGSGNIVINGRDLLYFKTLQERESVTFPLMFTNLIDIVDVDVQVTGGGVSTQGHAARHAISTCLAPLVDEEMRLRMKIAGLLQVDIRKRERKKFGQKGARAKFTWKKR